MGTLEKINIELTGIGRALLNKRLAVPIYQRSYAWVDKHILDLFSDLANAINQGEPEYFLGSIVTTKYNSPRPEVVDGQQRLATTVILLAAIRDYFFHNGDNERASTITSTYLYTKDLKTLEGIPKLQLNSADNEFFLKRILTDPNSPDRGIEPTKDSHKKIARAAELAKHQVANIAKLSNSTEHLIKWIEYVTDSLKVIWVAVSDDANAFTIFETLNDRGLALAISDLLKNYLFGLAGDRITEVQQRWMWMIGTLEAIDNEEIVVTYIRHLWSSKYGSTREKDLYSDIKKSIRSKLQSVEFATELAENAKLYAAMLNPAHELWQKYGPSANQHMNTLNLLQMIQIRPLVLSVLDRFSVSEAQRTLRLMVSWAVRFLITGGLGGGTLETHYSLRAKEIRDHTIKTAKQLSIKLKDIVPSDAQFKSAFATASVSKNYLARYYLRALEKQEGGKADPELVPNDNTDVVNLEHILPLNPSAAWNYISAEDIDANVKRIGNLTLLKTRINTDAGNDSFAYKKQFYQKSQIKLTSSLTKYPSWNVSDITKRQAELAELAVKTWALK